MTRTVTLHAHMQYVQCSNDIADVVNVVQPCQMEYSIINVRNDRIKEMCVIHGIDTGAQIRYQRGC